VVVTGSEVSAVRFHSVVGDYRSPHLLGCIYQDMFGYSFGWASPNSGLLTGTPLWIEEPTAKTAGVQLSTYRFFDTAPIQFDSSLHAQVNWHYDTGHNVPANLCPPETGCKVEYDVMTYLYLAAPAKASNATFPMGALGR
jgi:hypothetical protein